MNLTGPCGAFEITKRVAWALRGEGFGLVAKSPAQNGCNANGGRFAIDAIMLQDGQTFDILVSAGGEEDANRNPIAGTGNGPAWQVTGAAPRDAWRAPFEPAEIIGAHAAAAAQAAAAQAAAAAKLAAAAQAAAATSTSTTTPPPLSPSDVDWILAAQAAATERILAAIAELRKEAGNLGETLMPQLVGELLKRPR